MIPPAEKYYPCLSTGWEIYNVANCIVWMCATTGSFLLLLALVLIAVFGCSVTAAGLLLFAAIAVVGGMFGAWLHFLLWVGRRFRKEGGQ